MSGILLIFRKRAVIATELTHCINVYLKNIKASLTAEKKSIFQTFLKKLVKVTPDAMSPSIPIQEALDEHMIESENEDTDASSSSSEVDVESASESENMNEAASEEDEERMDAEASDEE